MSHRYQIYFFIRMKDCQIIGLNHNLEYTIYNKEKITKKKLVKYYFDVNMTYVM